MKIKRKASEKLKDEIQERFKESDLSTSAIAEITGVHQSHVSRICRGQFVTISPNVIEICKALGVKVEFVSSSVPKLEAHRKRIVDAALAVWDKTPEGAARIVKLLNQISELRKAAVNTDASGE
jgi:predicted XRE-type DNA-binding protein